MASDHAGESRIAQAARRAFKRELEHAGLWGIRRVPNSGQKQRDMLAQIDQLVDGYSRVSRSVPVVLPADDGDHTAYVEVTVQDALGDLRRELVSRIVTGAADSAATQLEEAADRLPEGQNSDDVRRVLAELNEARKLVEQQQDLDEATLRRDIQRNEHKAAMADRRRDRWFTRDTIAALAGAGLLLGFASVLTVMMFQGKQPSEIISNAFLLILGFFFGQGTRTGKGDS